MHFSSAFNESRLVCCLLSSAQRMFKRVSSEIWMSSYFWDIYLHWSVWNLHVLFYSMHFCVRNKWIFRHKSKWSRQKTPSYINEYLGEYILYTQYLLVFFCPHVLNVVKNLLYVHCTHRLATNKCVAPCTSYKDNNVAGQTMLLCNVFTK